MSDSEVITCSNPDCRVGDTNKCVEGFELTECTYYGKAAVAYEEVELDEEQSDTSTIALPIASKLSISAASQLLRQGECSVIAIIGPHDAGKTSLIASMYDLFQEGAVNGVKFASSSTLHAFEQACHDARAASQRAIAHSERTPHGNVEFYHIDVRGGSASDGMTLVLGDRSGETYKEAVNNISAAHDFCEVTRADIITILVDGERLLESAERHNVRQDIELIVQALVETKVAIRKPKIALVLTKIDSVIASENKERVERDFNILLEKLITNFDNHFSCIEPFKVSASPKHDGIKRGTGLSELLDYWLCQREHDWPVCTNLDYTSARMISRLTVLED